MSEIIRHLFRDTVTNEIFPVDSSFCIPEQALARHPKFILAKLEHGLGFADNRSNRFVLASSPSRDAKQEFDAK